jgi:dTDP-D-glucose 4,6-dehydratase
VSKLQALGWQPKISLRQGIEMTHRWYVEEEMPKMPKVSKIEKTKTKRVNTK